MKFTVKHEYHIIEKELQYSYIIERWLPDCEYEPSLNGSMMMFP